jgi:hypothetical protein
VKVKYFRLHSWHFSCRKQHLQFVSDVTVFRLLAIDGVGYSHVNKIRRYTGNTYVGACAIACKITVSNISGLYWEFHNIQYRRCGLSRQKDNSFFFLEDLVFLKKIHNIPCISRTPILEGKFLSKKCSLYTRKYVMSYNEYCSSSYALHWKSRVFSLWAKFTRNL